MYTKQYGVEASEPAIDASMRTNTERAVQLLGQLEELLEREMDRMRNRHTDELLELTKRKAQLVEDIDQLSSRVAPVLARFDDKDGLRLRAALERCQVLNSRNGVMARTAAEGARSAMVLLRTTLSFDDLTLYDAHGELAERRQTRSLGQA